MRQALACRHAFQRLGPHRCGLASRRLRSAHPFVGPALGSHRRWKCGHNRGARFSDARLCNGRPRHVETAPACSLTHITFKASQTQSFQRNNVPRRTILTERQRQSLFRLPDDAPTLLRHYVLSDEDLNRIRRCRRPRNRLGLALQLCALRYPGRLLQPSDVARTNVRLGRAKIAFTTINDVIFGLETIIVVYLAARLALNNTLTVGMIFAFMSYKQHFTDKSVQLVEKALDLRMLGLHLERMSDIALTPLEPDTIRRLPIRARSRAGSS